MDASLTASGQHEFGATATAGARGPGIKRVVDRLEMNVSQQAETIARHEKEILATGEDAVELVRGLESRMKAAIADLRTEVLQKMSVITNEITQLQKVVNVMKGESNILAQQSKDANRRIQSISAQMTELSMELLGEPTGPETA